MNQNNHFHGLKLPSAKGRPYCSGVNMFISPPPSQIPCGPVTCAPTTDDGSPGMSRCPPGTSCVLRHQGQCFTPPCGSRGHCISLPITHLPNTTDHRHEASYVTETSYRTQNNYGSKPCSVRDPSRGHTCCKITIVFDTDLLPLVGKHIKWVEALSWRIYLKDILAKYISIYTIP